jgi:hypothetical protein
MALSTHDYLKALLQDLLPPGGMSSDPTSTIGYICNSLAKILEYPQDAADQLALEVFPHTSQQSLDEWAALFKFVHPINASEADKQASLIGLWRAGTWPTPAGIRAVLAAALAPTVAFQDACDDSDVSVRYEIVTTNGSNDEDGSRLRIEGPAAADVQWDAGNSKPEVLLLDIIDTEDAFQVQALVDAYSVGTDGRAGVVIWESETDAVWWGLEDVSGTLRLRGGYIEDGVVFGPYETIAVPATPFWIQLRKVGNEYQFGYGAAIDSLTTAATKPSDMTIKPTKLGWYAANDATNLSQMDLETTRVQYDLTHNNVEVIERLASWGGDAGLVFSIFVHRQPGDDDYNIKAAQNIADRIKHAHTLITVGESDCFRCDDPYSRTDRDVLGQ